MLSVASLLNPVPSGLPPPTPRYRPSPDLSLSSPAHSFSSECHSRMHERYLLTSKPSKMLKDSGGFVKSKAKGSVNFPPFEALDEMSTREIKRYQIYPFGDITDYCRHIPYNSGKKDFYDKTGRESFEVFQYIFKIPGGDHEYTVMWDYNVGLVRMTPFFKCCKYSKTQPAKMLNMNPGLREITHSITGGSIMAQGYWMPFHCAKAVCTTFCGPIAGALIPIFGPEFPSQCTSPNAPEYGRMAIDPSIVAESTREADLFRRMYANATSVASNNLLPHHPHQSQIHNHHYSHGAALPSPTSIPSPRLARRALPRYTSPHDYERERVGLDGWMRSKQVAGGPFGVDPEPEVHRGGPEAPALHHALNRGIPYSPLSPPRSSGNGGGWTVVNHTSHPALPSHSHSVSQPTSPYHPSAYYRSDLPHPHPHTYPGDVKGRPNPILSAIPSFGHSQRLDHHPLPHHQPSGFANHRLAPLSTSATWQHNNMSSLNIKRRAADDDYDRASDKSSPTTTVTTSTATSVSQAPEDHEERAATGGGSSSRSGAEKNAALLLMNLSVRDHHKGDARMCGGGGKVLLRGEDNQESQQQLVPRGCGPESMSMSPVSGAADGVSHGHGHRSKRRRATSM